MKLKHTKIESMTPKALIATLNYYNEMIENKDIITFTMFVERCVEEHLPTHFVNVYRNNKAKGELTEYGFVDDNGDLMSIEQAEESFNCLSTLEHSFYHLFEFEEKKVMEVFKKD